MKKAQAFVMTTFLMTLVFPRTGCGQHARALCTPEVVAFSPGEKMQFDVYYNWGFVWLHAGEVEFKADTTLWNGKPAWRFLSTGTSRPSYDWFFKVRDRYESWATREDLKPLEFVRDTYEGGFECYNHYLFDYASEIMSATTFTSKRNTSVKAIPITGCLSDVLTAIYITRNLDIRTWTINQKMPMAMVLDDSRFDLYILYLGKETITHRNKKTYNCLKFSTSVAGGSIFKGGEAITVWVTDDKSHTPVLVQAEILVGSVKVYLRD
ncbi:MAG: hypothetical protein A2X11_03155 [Bacteroidetes bacterium GWE2_42_24]|nr:MAG: hypothetical protein A2X11_03155 [Bacteroidetes bacterium GWE2_42_24]OFY30450.1 MAG: hypothetical protein A2X09_12685 [Bacteroidetes bacterium GWF2_43_11]